MSPYEDAINTLLEKGTSGVEIEKMIRGRGYIGSSSLIRTYITEWKKKYKKLSVTSSQATESRNIICVKRASILKLLYFTEETINEIDSATIKLLFEQYTLVRQVIELVSSFKNIVVTGDVNALISWINEVKATDISELNSFVNGLERDFDAVINSIKLPFSNGLAEGKINKLKVIKRIMYGRCGFETLKNKVIGIERMM